MSVLRNEDPPPPPQKIQSVRLTIRAGKFLALGELGAFSKAESRLSPC